jgi:GH24 family phage-related lysozyme (muramidase)
MPQFRGRDDMIRFFEGSGKVRTQAYLDTEGIPTIGWGATHYQDGRPVKMGDVISPKDADKLYAHHIDTHAAQLRSLPGYKNFNDNERAALESFAYNAGPNFMQSQNYKTIADAIRSGDRAAIRNALPMYNNGGTLSSRRATELQMFNTPIPVKVNKKSEQGHFNPNSVGKMGPTYRPNSSADGLVISKRKNKTSKLDSRGVDEYVSGGKRGKSRNDKGLSKFDKEALSAVYGSKMDLGSILKINTGATAAAGDKYGPRVMNLDTSLINRIAWGGGSIL